MVGPDHRVQQATEHAADRRGLELHQIHHVVGLGGGTEQQQRARQQHGTDQNAGREKFHGEPGPRRFGWGGQNRRAF
jgi:hypothetical protein